MVSKIKIEYNSVHHKIMVKKSVNRVIPYWLKIIKKDAFSLVEMLMALLVASLLMMALAPVMTKRSELIHYEENKTLDDGTVVYVNPGTYGFEVPNNVENIRVQAAGGGGGGGGASYKTYTETYTDNRKITVPKGVYEISFNLIGGGGAGGNAMAATGADSCENGTNRIPSVADSSRDLCVHNGISPKTIYTVQTVAAGEACGADNCCWQDITNTLCTGSSCYKRGVCKYNGAVNWCGINMPYYGGIFKGPARLLTETEMQRIMDTKTEYMGSRGLNLCLRGQDGQNPYGLERCGLPQECTGSDNNHCYPMEVWLKDKITFNYWEETSTKNFMDLHLLSRAKSVVCVRELQDWFPYSGGGGASASKLTHKINVTPGDILEITAGAKGSPTSLNGREGNATYLYHKDSAGNLLGTYFARGGKGGNDATTSSNGAEIKALSPSCSNGGMCEFATENPDGLAASEIGGGAGGGGTEGSNFDSPDGKNAVTYGAGGGGGACKRGYKNTSYCKKGGYGGSSLISITYSIASPGGGGGAGGTIGYNALEGNSDFIVIPVKEKSVLNITVGAGGSGGGLNSNGVAGKDTVISTKEATYYFKGGSGGSAGSFNGNIQKGGAGGAGGSYPDKTSNSYKEAIVPLATGGLNGALDAKGLYGGSGGITATGYNGGCGGMEVNADNNCNSSTEKGSNAVNYDISTGRNGAAGGGGGGINILNKTFGNGGSGADGFIIIRWNAVSIDK